MAIVQWTFGVSVLRLQSASSQPSFRERARISQEKPRLGIPRADCRFSRVAFVGRGKLIETMIYAPYSEPR